MPTMHHACWRTLAVACFTVLSWAQSVVASAGDSAEDAALQDSAQLDRRIWRDALEPAEPELISMLFYQTDPLSVTDRRGEPYSPPRGAMGQLWGTPREKFTELETTPFAVQVLPLRGYIWLLAEYYTPGFYLGKGGRLLRVPPASLMFCAQQHAQWPLRIPFPSMSLCGLRLRIHRDSVENVLAPAPPPFEFISATEHLRKAFGEPDDFSPAAAVGGDCARVLLDCAHVS